MSDDSSRPITRSQITPPIDGVLVTDVIARLHPPLTPAAVRSLAPFEAPQPLVPPPVTPQKPFSPPIDMATPPPAALPVDNASRRTPKIDVGEFSGDKNLTESFLEKFLRAANVNGWNDIERIQFFPCFLAGPVLAWFEVFSSAQPDLKSWQTFKTAFEQAFHPLGKREKVIVRLRNRKRP